MKAKIIKAFLTVIAAFLVSEAFFLVVHFSVIDKYERIVDNLVSEYRLSKSTTDLVNSFYDLIQYSNDQQRVAIFKNNLESVQTLLAKLDNNLSGNDSWAVYLGVRNTINTVINEIKKGNDDISAGNFSEVTTDYLKAAQDNNFVKENTGNLLLKELENVEKTEKDIAATKYWSELTGLILLIIVALGSVLYAFFCAKKMSEPMRRLAEFSKKIGAGDYEGEIDDSVANEGGELATMADSLNSLQKTLKEKAEKKKPKGTQLFQAPIPPPDDEMPPPNS